MRAHSHPTPADAPGLSPGLLHTLPWLLVYSLELWGIVLQSIQLLLAYCHAS